MHVQSRVNESSESGFKRPYVNHIFFASYNSNRISYCHILSTMFEPHILYIYLFLSYSCELIFLEHPKDLLLFRICIFCPKSPSSPQINRLTMTNKSFLLSRSPILPGTTRALRINMLQKFGLATSIFKEPLSSTSSWLLPILSLYCVTKLKQNIRESGQTWM